MTLPSVGAFLAPLYRFSFLPVWLAQHAFSSAARAAAHQASSPFVAFAEPVMITFQESPKGASIERGLLLNEASLCCETLVQFCFRGRFPRHGCFTAGSLHPLARSPTVEFGVSLRPCFNNFQHIELNLSGPHAALGRSREPKYATRAASTLG